MAFIAEHIKRPRRMLGANSCTAAFSVDVPAGSVIHDIHFGEVSGNAIVGGLRVGTTDGGADVVAVTAVTGNAFGRLTLLKTHFASAVTLYFTALTSWGSAELEVLVDWQCVRL